MNRTMVHEAVIGYRQLMDKLVDEVKAGNALTRDEQLARYTQEHRGNPQAMVAFAARYAPQGTSAVEAAKGYEQAMEAQLKPKN